jgi:protein-tyrosine phosphatase
MYFIIPQLYLSDYEDAKQAPSHWFIVNCTKDLPMVGPGIRLPVNDDLSPDAMETMTHELPKVLSTIENVRANGGKVLVHCFAGQQRSAAVVAAYMMTHGMCKQDAIQFVRSKKPDAFLTGVNFDPVLENFSKNSRACLSPSF